LRYSNLHSALFILLVLHHLRPTPLPYTTLFRSHQDRPRLRAGPARRPRERGDRPGDHDDGRETRPAGDGRGGRDGGGTARTALADRKSTRLNSSHVKISYAVFCLKKKNEQSKLM